jgi:very-short-patch-repair endonuclease
VSPAYNSPPAPFIPADDGRNPASCCAELRLRAPYVRESAPGRHLGLSFAHAPFPHSENLGRFSTQKPLAVLRPTTLRERHSMDDALTRADLLAMGMTGRGITDAVQTGRLVRLRNGHYTTATAGRPLQRAVRFGGRLGCVSELRSRGVWTREPTSTHVHLAPNASRLRQVEGVVPHWHPLIDPAWATRSHVGVIDALVRAAECLPRAEAVAAIDSALNLGLVTRSRLEQVTGEGSFAARLAEADGAAQSGLETFVRLLARDLGFRVAIQVRFAGIGYADLLIEDCVVVETDGSEFHDAAAPSVRDRRRDALHAAAGRTALRFRYSQVVYELPTVAAAIIGAVESHRRVQNSGRRASIARNRARRRGLA